MTSKWMEFHFGLLLSTLKTKLVAEEAALSVEKFPLERCSCPGWGCGSDCTAAINCSIFVVLSGYIECASMSRRLEILSVRTWRSILYSLSCGILFRLPNLWCNLQTLPQRHEFIRTITSAPVPLGWTYSLIIVTYSIAIRIAAKLYRPWWIMLV